MSVITFFLNYVDVCRDDIVANLIEIPHLIGEAKLNLATYAGAPQVFYSLNPPSIAYILNVFCER